MKKMKKYELGCRELSERAFDIYSNSDISIYAVDDLLYVRGSIEVDGITLEQLETMLIELAEDEE